MSDLTVVEFQRQLADRLYIEMLITKYAKARDTTEPNLYKEVFDESAKIKFPNGKVMAENLNVILGKVETDKERFNEHFSEETETYSKVRHVVSNISINVAGNFATSTYYVLTYGFNSNLSKPELASVARNVDEYEKKSDIWFIVSSTLHYDWGNDEMAKLLEFGPYTPAKYRNK